MATLRNLYKRGTGMGALAVVGIVVLVLILIAAALLFGAWVIMLIWGGLANFFGFRTISLGIAILISLGLWIVGGIFSRSSSS